MLRAARFDGREIPVCLVGAENGKAFAISAAQPQFRSVAQFEQRVAGAERRDLGNAIDGDDRAAMNSRELPGIQLRLQARQAFPNQVNRRPGMEGDIVAWASIQSTLLSSSSVTRPRALTGMRAR